MTLSDLRRIMPHASPARATEFLPPLTETMEEFEINTPARQAAFLATLAHESGELRYVREIASGDAYEGRADLGNLEAGDGRRFKGRGLIQITGRANYSQCALALGLPLIEKPEILEQTVPACRSAGWFWSHKNLNELADQGDFLLISKRVNGFNRSTGLPNHWEERRLYWERAKKALA